MQALILAGGLGTRLRPLFPDLPKALVPVGQKPFLKLILKHWKTQGVAQFIISTGHQAEQIEQAIGLDFEGVPVRYVRETSPQGTGGAILLALESGLETPLLILNGDTFFPCALEELTAKTGDFIMALTQVSDTRRYGRVEMDSQQRILSLSSEQSGPGWVNAGLYLLHRPQLLSASTRPVSLENDMIPQMLRAGVRVVACPSRATFVDMGTPEGLEQARCELEGENT